MARAALAFTLKSPLAERSPFLHFPGVFKRFHHDVRFRQPDPLPHSP